MQVLDSRLIIIACLLRFFEIKLKARAIDGQIVSPARFMFGFPRPRSYHAIVRMVSK